jgi:hypothetical protein
MTLEEIKKEMYKQKPIAHFKSIKNGVVYYYADLIKERIEFCIPVNDMGEAEFKANMEAQFLNRWIVLF